MRKILLMSKNNTENRYTETAIEPINAYQSRMIIGFDIVTREKLDRGDYASFFLL